VPRWLHRQLAGRFAVAVSDVTSSPGNGLPTRTLRKENIVEGLKWAGTCTAFFFFFLWRAVMVACGRWRLAGWAGCGVQQVPVRRGDCQRRGAAEETADPGTINQRVQRGPHSSTGLFASLVSYMDAKGATFCAWKGGPVSRENHKQLQTIGYLQGRGWTSK